MEGLPLHGILSISALHFALIGTSPQKTPSWPHHHGMGIDLFQPHLVHLTAKNKDAAFTFTCVAIPCARLVSSNY